MKKGGLRAFKTPSFSMNGFQFKNHAKLYAPLAEIRGAKWPGLFQYQIKSTDRPPNHFCNVIKAQATPIRIFDLV